MNHWIPTEYMVLHVTRSAFPQKRQPQATAKVYMYTCQTVVELCVLVADGERGAAAYVPICWVGAP